MNDVAHLGFATALESEAVLTTVAVTVSDKAETVIVNKGIYTFAPALAEPVVERIGMYVVSDDLPSEAELDDGGEYERAMANSRPGR